MVPSKVWTTELHVAFLDAVNALGGPTLAKPKKILAHMGQVAKEAGKCASRCSGGGGCFESHPWFTTLSIFVDSGGLKYMQVDGRVWGSSGDDCE